MMESQESLAVPITEVEAYAWNLLERELPRERVFHSIHHTLTVVQTATTLGKHFKLPPLQMNAVLTAAWFHDTGYCVAAKNHESFSIEIFNRFASAKSLHSSFVVQVVDLIHSTRLSHRSNDLLEEILSDADMYHLASQEYSVWSILLKKEVEFDTGKSMDISEWNQINAAFFMSHRYLTEYAIRWWEPQKKKNLKLLKA